MNRKTTQTKRVSTKRREDLFGFRWYRPANVGSGYRLAEDGKSIERDGTKLVAYAPEEVKPALHHQFARLFSRVVRASEFDPTESALYGDASTPLEERCFRSHADAILAFANAFGPLGIKLGTRSDLSLDALASEHRDRAPGSALIELNSEPIDLWLAEQLKVATFFGAGLDAGHAPRSHVFNRIAEPQMTIKLQPDARGRNQMRVVPRRLVDWMWLKLAEDCANGVSWGACKYCEKPMPHGPGAYRIGAEYCSPKCRTYFNRQRVAADQAKRKHK